MTAEIIPAVITPLDQHMGLDIARSLHAHGIAVYGLDHDRHAAGRFSSACQWVECTDPLEDEAEFVRELAGFAQSLRCKPVLFALSDEHVRAISRNRDALKEYYQCVMPADEIVEALRSKAGLARVAAELHLPAPVTVFPASVDELEQVSGSLPYPVIIKPAESPQWHSLLVERELACGVLGGRAKVLLCRDAQELHDSYCRLARFTSGLLVQEVIPGEDSRLHYVSFYLDRSGRPLAAFAGRKDRVLPVGFGSASFVHSLCDPALIEAGERVLVGMCYQGLGGVELKKDPRDEIYKLIEVNTRFGMWDGLGARCGVDLAYIAYRDTLGLAVQPRSSFRSGVIWLDWQRDLRATVAYRQAGQLSWRNWLASLRGEKQIAIYSCSDPLPGLMFTLQLIATLLNRLFARLWERLQARAIG